MSFLSAIFVIAIVIFPISILTVAVLNPFFQVRDLFFEFNHF